jgi:uncharacterized protein (DUF58 family)
MTKVQQNIDIVSRKRIFSNLLGEHSSLYSGNGLDFKELREYTNGDDIRHINWKVTARTVTPTVNIYNEDKQLNVVLVYLNSGSTYFGTQKSKKDLMMQIYAMLGFSVVNKKDSLTTIIYSNKIDKFYKPTKHKAAVDMVLKDIDTQKSLGKDIDYDGLSNYLLSRIKQKSLIFIIGDFLEIPNFKLIGAKHEVYCVISRDKFEEDLKLFGEFNFINTNNGEAKNIYLDDGSVKKYNMLMKEHDYKLFEHFKKSNIRYKKIYTAKNENIALKLKQLTKV